LIYFYTTWATLPAHSGLVIFEIGSCFMSGSAWTSILLFVLSHIARSDRCTPLHPGEVGFREVFALGWQIEQQSSWSLPPK
jgi:hypothetical protein